LALQENRDEKDGGGGRIPLPMPRNEPGKVTEKKKRWSVKGNIPPDCRPRKQWGGGGGGGAGASMGTKGGLGTQQPKRH